MPSWTPPANPPATIAPSLTSILKPCPSSQTATPGQVYTYTVHFMKCSRGNGDLYGSNSERLSFSDNWKGFTDFLWWRAHGHPFHFLIFFMLHKIFILFNNKNFCGPAKKSVSTVLYYQQSWHNCRLLPLKYHNH